MKKLRAYILLTVFVLQAANLHKPDLVQIRYFVINAYDHLSRGNSFVEFLQLHYGDEQTVYAHYKDEHPGEKPLKKEKHDHSFHLSDVAFYTVRTGYEIEVEPSGAANYPYKPYNPRLTLKNLFHPPDLRG
jgi:hypothetical protein